ncbi:hypothetical protein AT238_05130 [Bartonella henselae]|nr:hypothetical protein AT239_03580 [Bartonella henselae]OLL54768.1 hypothetical protein AT238_05130 [Bartonella henselae]OLL54917.1 hypothetical protein AT240_07720 [Bartonella henselae]
MFFLLPLLEDWNENSFEYRGFRKAFLKGLSSVLSCFWASLSVSPFFGRNFLSEFVLFEQPLQGESWEKNSF